MSEHRIYTGNEIINLPDDNTAPLIDKLIWERDTVLLVGKEKAGKSILSLQMAFSVSGGEPFLYEYKTKKSCCLYIMTEGKLKGGQGSMRNNILNMLEGLNWQEENFNLFYYFGLALNTTVGLVDLVKMIDKKIDLGMPVPRLIILDPLYMCIRGDLNSQEQATELSKNIRLLGDKYNATIIVVHHEHKAKRKDTGEIIVEGDDASFGSFVWKAFPDHTLLLRKVRGGTRELTCNTQRSGRVVNKIELTLVEPVPLMFEMKSDVSPVTNTVLKMLELGTVTPEEICMKTELPYNTVRTVLSNLRKMGMASKGKDMKWRKGDGK